MFESISYNQTFSRGIPVYVAVDSQSPVARLCAYLSCSCEPWRCARRGLACGWLRIHTRLHCCWIADRGWCRACSCWPLLCRRCSEKMLIPSVRLLLRERGGLLGTLCQSQCQQAGGTLWGWRWWNQRHRANRWSFLRGFHWRCCCGENRSISFIYKAVVYL